MESFTTILNSYSSHYIFLLKHCTVDVTEVVEVGFKRRAITHNLFCIIEPKFKMLVL